MTFKTEITRQSNEGFLRELRRAIEAAERAIPKHWKELLGDVETVVTDAPFELTGEARRFLDGRESEVERDFPNTFAGMLVGPHKTLVFVGGKRYGPLDRERAQEAFLLMLARHMLKKHPKLMECLGEAAPGTEGHVLILAFNDNFPKFVLDKHFMSRNRGVIADYMYGVDHRVQHHHVMPRRHG